MSYNHLAKIGSKIFFGKYVDNQVQDELEQIGIDLIVDVTHPNDTLSPYQCDIPVIKFPIIDMNIADDDAVWELIRELCGKLRMSQKIYVHCKGGHGRSAVIAACLYGTYYGKSGTASLKKIYEAHQKRIVMRPQWRKIGAPQTSAQVQQVLRILGNGYD